MAISVLSDYLHTIQNRDGETESLYRGQANVLWRVDCSAVRRLAAGSEIDPTLIGHALVAYTDDLLAGASRFVGTCPELSISCSELDILAQLQHQGAATGLMDFTTNPLVALWFACNECFDHDGAVYVLSRSDLQEIKSNEVGMQRVVEYFHGAGLRNEPPVFWRPDGLPGRAKSQDSVFVFGVPILWPTRLERIVIDKKSKSALLDELRVAHNITRDTLFPDLAGYASSNSSSQPFDSRRISQFWERRIEKHAADDASSAQAYVDCGLAYVELQQYAKAKELFTEAITVDTTNIGAYVNRAGAERHLEHYEAALADYDAAIELLEKSKDVSQPQIGRIYWDRGETLKKLGQTERALDDFNYAIQLGHQMYLLEGRIVDSVEKHSQYRS